MTHLNPQRWGANFCDFFASYTYKSTAVHLISKIYFSHDIHVILCVHFISKKVEIFQKGTVYERVWGKTALFFRFRAQARNFTLYWNGQFKFQLPIGWVDRMWESPAAGWEHTILVKPSERAPNLAVDTSSATARKYRWRHQQLQTSDPVLNKDWQLLQLHLS